jgi:hypothetical protein
MTNLSFFRMKNTYLLLLAFLLAFIEKSHSQNVWVNYEALQSIAQAENERFSREKEKAIQWAQENGLPISFTAEDNTKYELMRVVENMPVYYSTNNLTAAISTSTNHVWPGGRSGFNIDGAGMTMREWDAGAVLLSHQEFDGRVVQGDNAILLDDHATHVAGTLVAGGVNPLAIGMSYAANLRAFDWNNDNSEMAAEAANGALVSCHSYGERAGWVMGSFSGTLGWHWFGLSLVSEIEDYKFGFYDETASTWDNISVNAPYYLIVKASGNDRGKGITTGTHFFFNFFGGWQTSNTSRQLDGGPDGYDCISTFGTAKNILTVGAVHDVTNGYTQPTDVVMTYFSSWGPTDDGRIKPDIVGDGVNVLSTVTASVTSYEAYSGTSMATPNVAGSLLLLQSLYEKTNNKYMRSASLRGLAIHTADEAGPHPGPDYMFGWGLLNTEKAAKHIVDSVGSLILEEILSPAQTYTYDFFADGVTPVKATLCWTDPSAPASRIRLNQTDTKLINDLDIRIIKTNDATFQELPWILDPAQPSAPAAKGDNIRDNVEVIDAGILPKGIYQVTVTHKGNLDVSVFPGNTQPFSLILSGVFPESFNRPVVVGIGTQAPHESAILDLESTEKGFLPPRMTTAQRDAIASPAEGLVIFNLDNNSIEFFNGNCWMDFSTGSNLPLKAAFGGEESIIEIGQTYYRLHAYLNTGQFDFQVNRNINAKILVVAGGGGGGARDITGGGGAGGLIFRNNEQLSPGIYNVTVGAGGNGGFDVGVPLMAGRGERRGSNGQPSSFTGGPNLNAIGGGGGGGWGLAGLNGGSGGGAGSLNSQNSPGRGTLGQGFDGGLGAASGTTNYGGGGGGGASEKGFDADGPDIALRKKGGDGIDYSAHFGTAYGDNGVFGGGGGGAGHRTSGSGDLGLGGLGGGGAAGINQGGHGLPNSGGGGGGSRSQNAAGGNGGSGIVLIIYEVTYEEYCVNP